MHGTRRTASRALAALVAEVDGAARHAGSTADLLQQWWEAASAGWAATTAAHTRSIIGCHLTPELGEVPVAALTTVDIDRMYGRLLTGGGNGGGGLAATTGARRGQLLALRWRDLELDRGAVAFTRALVMGPDGPVLAATKTDRTHQVELDRHTLDLVRTHHDHRVGGAAGGDRFLIARDPDGRSPWPPSRATHAFIAARRAAGLPHFRLHDLRHFMATHMLAAGVPLATVAQRLNHARISTTVNVYTHAIRAGDRPAAETLAALLEPEGRQPGQIGHAA